MEDSNNADYSEGLFLGRSSRTMDIAQLPRDSHEVIRIVKVHQLQVLRNRSIVSSGGKDRCRNLLLPHSISYDDDMKDVSSG